MASVDPERAAKDSEHPSTHHNVLKHEEEKRPELLEFDQDNSEFMRPLAEPKSL
jgi:hypothetical protein